jgi:HEAT repeat protein
MMRTLCSSSTLACAISLVLALGGRLAIAQQVSPDNTVESVVQLEEDCPFSVDKFIAELQQEDSGRRWWAAECLGKMKDRQAVEPLVQAIFNEHIPRLGLVEIAALTELDDPRTEDLLLNGINDKRTRPQAIDALGRLHSKRAVEPIIATLKNPDRFSTSVAMQALGEIQDPRALQPLCTLLKNRDEVVRRFAATALGRLDDPEAVGSLTAALKDADDGVRANATKSLGELKNAEAVNALVAVLKDTEESVRVAAVDALGSIGDASAVAPLLATLKSAKGRVRWHAASALAMFSTPEIDDALTNALRHGELDIVAAAYRHFLLKHDPESVAALVAAMIEHGWYEMAAAFRDSGDSRLVDAAKQWELRHDVELQAQP